MTRTGILLPLLVVVLALSPGSLVARDKPPAAQNAPPQVRAGDALTNYPAQFGLFLGPYFVCIQWHCQIGAFAINAVADGAIIGVKVNTCGP